MNKKDEALKLALEALLSCSAGDYSTGHVIHPSFDVDAVNKAIEAIDALAEQPAQQQEPVATFDEVWDAIDWDKWRMEPIRELVRMIHGKTSPPASKPWVEITPEELMGAANQQVVPKAFAAGAAWANAKLREKNA